MQQTEKARACGHRVDLLLKEKQVHPGPISTEVISSEAKLIGYLENYSECPFFSSTPLWASTPGLLTTPAHAPTVTAFALQ